MTPPAQRSGERASVEAEREQLYLIDASGLAYRSYYAFQKRPLRTSTGIETSAVYGFVQTLSQLMRQAPAYVAVVFDLPGPTMRHEVYAAYKAQRPPTPESLIEQIRRIREVVRALGLPILQKQGVEADDIIATVAKWGEAGGKDTVMVSGDKDLFQMVGPRVKALIPGTGSKGAALLDTEGVRQKMGVPPERVPDLLGLMGDSTDNIPGVPGVGAKTAAQLIQEFGSIEGVYENLERVGPSRARRALAEHRDEAYLSRALVRLKTDVRLEASLDDLRPAQPDTDRLEALFRELEFTRFLAEIVPREEGAAGESAVVEGAEGVAALVGRLKRSPHLVVEIDPGPSRGSPPRAVHFCSGEGGVYTLPLEPGDREVPQALRPLLEAEEPAKWVLSSKGLTRVLAPLGISLAGVAFDVELAAYLLDPGHQRDLAQLCAQYLGRLPEGIEPGAGRGTLEIPFGVSKRTGSERARVVPALVSTLEGCLEDQGLTALLREVEIPLAQVLVEMEQTGVKVDAALLGRMGGRLGEEIRRTEEEVFERVGERFNLASPQQLKRILFDVLGLKPGRRTKTGFSTDSSVLETLGRTHEVPRLVLKYRHLSKLKSTYVDALPAMVDPETGRIHTTFHQTVTATGRLSSSDPNLQNIPMRTELGRELRKAFVSSGPGWRLYSADYSQIELRIVAHFARDERLMEAFRRGEDVHRATAAAVLGIRPEDVSPEARDRAKAVNFGIIYGMGPRALAASVGIQVAEAKAFIESYFETYPGVRAFVDQTVGEARRRGYVSTFFGRRRFLPGIESESPRDRAFAERTAVNTRVQGTAADITKRAMVRIALRLATQALDARMILQVHDELVFDTPAEELDELKAIVTEEMVGAAPLDVPVEVSSGEGMNWFEAH